MVWRDRRTLRRMQTAATRPPLIVRQFLLWVAAQPRTYGETMDAWRTSCPRLSVWEDAVADGLVELADAASQAERAVSLTQTGATLLEEWQ
jgi:hypothetical protein